MTKNITLIVSLQILGATLIVAALVIPAITARLLTDSFNRMILFSTLIGTFTGLAGMYLSYYVNIASGATIVLLQAAIFALVLTLLSLQKRSARRLLHTRIDIGISSTSAKPAGRAGTSCATRICASTIGLWIQICT